MADALATADAKLSPPPVQQQAAGSKRKRTSTVSDRPPSRGAPATRSSTTGLSAANSSAMVSTTGDEVPPMTIATSGPSEPAHQPATPPPQTSNQGVSPDIVNYTTDLGDLPHHPGGSADVESPADADALAEPSVSDSRRDTAVAALTHYNMNNMQNQEVNPYPLDQLKDSTQSAGPSPHDHAIVAATVGHGSPLGPTSATSPSQKPMVGSEEWHRVRRNNHKEVERRRRETINEGINELAKIVPGCEKNKGAIVQRAVQFIQTLKDNEQHNIEKWSFEKMLTDQTISELGSAVEKFKNDADVANREVARLREAMRRQGMDPDGADVTSIADEASAAADGQARAPSTTSDHHQQQQQQQQHQQSAVTTSPQSTRATRATSSSVMA